MADFRHRARRRMPRMIFDFVDGGAGSEMASRLNIETLEAIRLQPRVLVNVEGRQLTKTLFGHRWGLPFGIAPMGMCNLFWPGADTALAATATERNIPLCLSTMGSTSIEHMSGLAGRNAWFQLYVGESLELAMSLMRRAAMPRQLPVGISCKLYLSLFSNSTRCCSVTPRSMSI